MWKFVNCQPFRYIPVKIYKNKFKSNETGGATQHQNRQTNDVAGQMLKLCFVTH